LSLERSIDSLAKRLNRFDPVFPSSNKIGLSHWKDKPIIPLDEWIRFRDTPYALDYFPDDFDQLLTYISEDELEKGRERKDVEKWDSEHLELMEYTKNSNFGKLKCFHCLLSPTGDDPIFIGINRLVAKGLTIGEPEKDPIQYPCQVVNRFQCPYERINTKEEDVANTNSYFDVEDLFRLHRMAFAVEIALAKAIKNDSKIQIKDKGDLFHALTDRDTFTKILQQAADTLKGIEYFREISDGQDNGQIVEYFMKIRDKIELDELRLY
jgi:hypothetical protein